MSYTLTDVQALGGKFLLSNDYIRQATNAFSQALDQYVAIMNDPALSIIFPTVGSSWNEFVVQISEYFKNFLLNAPQMPPLVGG